MQYYDEHAITARGADGKLYTIYEADGFFDSSVAERALTCDAGPVICIAPHKYEIWVQSDWGPFRVVAIEQQPRLR